MNKDKITLFDFCKKKYAKNFQGVYDETCLNEDGTIISPLDQAAIISHHLQLKNTKDDDTYKERGEKLIELWQDFIDPQTKLSESSLKDGSHFYGSFFDDVYKAPFQGPKDHKFTFIDLFAGIGGFRLAMQAQGGKCVFSSEWNEYAQKTYYANYGEVPFGDITKESTKQLIPKNFDVLCAGFPCQPFSIAGVSKKKSLGRETGFRDKTQGTLFFDVADIISRYRPKAFYLENVKNLCSHDKGNTFKVICETLKELEYSIHTEVMDGKAFVPQHRERIFIVGFDKRIYNENETFSFPTLGDPQKTIKDILDAKVEEKYTLSDKLWKYLQDYAVTQKKKGNGFGYGLVDLNGISRTLSARYYKDGAEILIPQGEGRNPRRLTPRECSRLMGYPENFIIDKVSEIQAYKQCGNSVIVPLVTAVAEQLVKSMLKK